MSATVINTLKIRLIKTPEYNSEKYLEVCYFLQSFDGPMEFIEDENFADEQLRPQYQEGYSHNSSYEYYEKMGANFGDDNSLFNFCALYKDENGFNNDDSIVVLLTNYKGSDNIPNIYDSHNNIVIAVAEWDKYPEVDDLYPITHLIIKTIFQKISDSPEGPIEMDTTHEIKKKRKEITSHEAPINCINDLTENHFRVLLKLNNTEFCDSCVRTQINKKVNYRIQNQGNAIFTAIAKINQRKPKSPKFDSKYRLYTNIVLFDKNKIVFDDFDSKVYLAPIYRALYVFFLINCDVSGIKLSDLPLYKTSILKLYKLFNVKDVSESELDKQIENLTNNRRDSFVQKRSLIKRILIRELGLTRAENYIIQGEPTMTLKINIAKNSISVNDENISELKSFSEIRFSYSKKNTDW